MKELTDQERIDWLEWMAKQPQGLLLHAEFQLPRRLGLGFAYPARSLRRAIDQAIEHDADWEKHKAARINRARDQG